MNFLELDNISLITRSFIWRFYLNLSFEFTSSSCGHAEWSLHSIWFRYTKVWCLQSMNFLQFTSEIILYQSLQLIAGRDNRGRLHGGFRSSSQKWSKSCQRNIAHVSEPSRGGQKLSDQTQAWCLSENQDRPAHRTLLRWSGWSEDAQILPVWWHSQHSLQVGRPGTLINKALSQYFLFRMESNGEPLKIHCSEITYNALQVFKSFNLEFRDILEVKGKPKMKTFWLLGENNEKLKLLQ